MTNSLLSSSSTRKRPILKNSTTSSTLDSSHSRSSSSSSGAAGDLIIKKVWFDSVAINYHKIILGDNPAVSDGAPITIGWKSHEQEVIDIDCFEATRPPKPKKVSALKLPVEDRAALLLDNGYSIKQLAKIIQQVEETQRHRALSFESSKWDRILELKESSGKIFRKLAGLNRDSSSPTNSGGSSSGTTKKNATSNPAA